MRYNVDYIWLQKYLIDLKYNDFESFHSKEFNHKIPFVETILDHPDRDDVLWYWEPFLVDILWNDLSIVRPAKTKERIWWRWLNVRFDRTIVPDCRWIYWSPLNWCWKIPEKFIN